jgi:glycosyltransferase involved in cell wall biosynthesis/putative flippase GtrA
MGSMTTLDEPALTIPAVATQAPTLDIVVPVFNEEHVLAASIERLHAHLRANMPFSWQITVVDNGSTDSTMRVATDLATRLKGVRVRHLDRKGRGFALRTAWTASDSPVLAYMDVDLSTGLDALLPLVASLVTGHSDVAIGSRLAAGASVARGPKRELISRSYNLILHTVFATRFHDAQCGFKALRSDAAAALLPQIADDNWFFDTELLLLAEHNGLRVHEVPVDWVDDPDSRVHVARTAREDLAGVARMAWRFLRGAGRIESGAYRRAELDDQMGRQLVVFGLIGLSSTAVSAAIFLATRHPLGAVLANLVAVTSTVAVNAWANRRYTFGRRGRLGRSTDYLRAGATYLVGLVVSTVVLLAVGSAGSGRVLEFLALLATWSLTTIARFTLLSRKVPS